MKKQLLLLFPMALGAVMLAGCANVPPEAGQRPEDPYEGFNRQMFAFNDSLDRVVVKPITEGYRWAVPEKAREGVSNVVDNLGEPNNALNHFLQGKVSEGIASTFRFLLNSTLGVVGIFDVATWVGMEKTNEDFGQTLGVWGFGEGPYLVLPILGPSTGRDVFKWPVDAATDPMTYVLWDEKWYWRVGYALGEGVDLRSRMMDAGLDDMRLNVVDEYVAVRDAYLQQRRNAVADGERSVEEELETLTPLSFEDDEAPVGEDVK